MKPNICVFDSCCLRVPIMCLNLFVFVVGGVDLLLHLLSNIIALPVNKSNVKDSGMGKAIGSIDKHKICAGTPNEAGIKERVSKVKAAWQKSVKLLKEKKNELPVEASSQLETSKRDLDSNVDVAPASKKARTETDEKKKPSSLSSLLNKVKPGRSSIGKNGSSSSPTASGSQKDGKNFLPYFYLATPSHILSHHFTL